MKKSQAQISRNFHHIFFPSAFFMQSRTSNINNFGCKTYGNNQHFSLDINGKIQKTCWLFPKILSRFKYKIIDVRNSVKVLTRAVSVKTKH